MLIGASSFLAAIAAPEARAQAGPDTAAAADEAIVVTGSRIKRTDLESPAPVAVLSSDYIAQQGAVTLESVLNALPQLKPDNARTQGNSGGEGVLKANLRGLGPSRTLVLVNGRRYTPADTTGAVDLATIPSMLVERSEVLTGGASAVYGSDAVAGAINFVLRDEFEGSEAQVSYGQTAENDAQTVTLDWLFGRSFNKDRGNLAIAASYFDGEGVALNARDFSRTPVDPNTNVTNGAAAGTALVYTGSGTTEGGYVASGGSNGVTSTACPDGSRSGGVEFKADGAPETYCAPADTYDYNASGSLLMRPLTRYQASVIGHYDLTDAVTAFSELYFIHSKNENEAAPYGAAYSLRLNNYAANTTLSQATRDYLSANSASYDASNSGTARLTLRRRFSDVGNRLTTYERDSFSGTLGLKGDLALLKDKPWSWEAYATYQTSSQDALYENFVSSARVAAGSNVSVSNGVVSCATTTYADCVPINLFGTNSLTRQMADFIAPDLEAHTEFTRGDFGASIAGDLFTLPGGPVSAAIGVEYRRETYNFRPDAALYNGELATSTGPATNGAISVREAFLEATAPVIGDLLSLEAGVRITDYSSSGIDNPVTYKAGGQLTPLSWLRVRGMYNRAIRAPNLRELYSSISATNLTILDPCRSAANPSVEVQNFCVSQGVPASSISGFTQINNFALVLTGGNTDLDVETATSVTGGVVLSPARRFNIAVDYWSIDVDDAIAAPSGSTLVNSCFTSLDLNSPACQTITRDASGQLSSVAANFNNIANRKVSGVDLAVDYAMDAPFLAPGDTLSELRFALQVTRQFEDETTETAGGPSVDCVGHYMSTCSGIGISMTPETRALGNVTWILGPLQTGVQARWIDSFTPLPGTTTTIKRIPTVIYFDLNGAYDLNPSARVSVSVQNVLDEDPKVVGVTAFGDPNVDTSLYDVLGARFSATFAMKF